MNRECKKCVGFKTRQGTGSFGECRINPPTRKGFPGVNESDGCFNGFILNRAKYDITGRKIYTRKDKRVIKNKAQLDAYHAGDKNWADVDGPLWAETN